MTDGSFGILLLHAFNILVMTSMVDNAIQITRNAEHEQLQPSASEFGLSIMDFGALPAQKSYFTAHSWGRPRFLPRAKKKISPWARLLYDLRYSQNQFQQGKTNFQQVHCMHPFPQLKNKYNSKQYQFQCLHQFAYHHCSSQLQPQIPSLNPIKTRNVEQI